MGKEERPGIRIRGDLQQPEKVSWADKKSKRAAQLVRPGRVLFAGCGTPRAEPKRRSCCKIVLLCSNHVDIVVQSV